MKATYKARICRSTRDRPCQGGHPRAFLFLLCWPNCNERSFIVSQTWWGCASKLTCWPLSGRGDSDCFLGRCRCRESTAHSAWLRSCRGLDDVGVHFRTEAPVACDGLENRGVRRPGSSSPVSQMKRLRWYWRPSVAHSDDAYVCFYRDRDSSAVILCTVGKHNNNYIPGISPVIGGSRGTNERWRDGPIGVRCGAVVGAAVSHAAGTGSWAQGPGTRVIWYPAVPFTREMVGSAIWPCQ